ncbi:MAG TPA: hypothetical protein VKB86_19565, partial [Pyrinomonadaceae bacterium]|nr:hypothetical protein [Pyrinomonadaceae bacterium]
MKHDSIASITHIETSSSTSRRASALVSNISLFALIVLSWCLMASSVLVQGQQTAARPDRGVNPGGAYSVSDVENINLQNGNLNLSIPLASLPPIAGGKLSLT